MDTLMLSRLQFAAATMFHFLFVPLTLGLSVLLAILESCYVRTGDEDYKTLTKFFGKLFLINFAIGVVTGITLEFQFGTNWSRYSQYVGDIFGSLLAVEATVAFFLESTFIAVWYLGWNRLSKRAHAAVIWVVALASNMSAFWILVANSWMQNPVGFVMRNGRAEMADFLAVVTQPYAIVTFLHTVAAAFVLSGFFVMGVSAYHILKTAHRPLFKKSFVTAASFTLVFVIFLVAQGHEHGGHVYKYQPAKLAAMESHWVTEKNAPQYFILIPDPKNERNKVEALPIPGFLSFLAAHDFNAEVKGLKDFPPEDRPPVMPVFVAFRAMAFLGFLFLGVCVLAWWKRANIEKYPLLLRGIIALIPLPYLACLLGWTVTEVGRQPWLVYGLMRTADGVSPVPAANVLVSLIAFIAVYTLLGVLNFYLIIKFAKQGPDALSGAPAKEAA